MQIGDKVLLKCYRSNPVGYEQVLTFRDACVVEMIDGDTALRVRKIPRRAGKTVRE